MDSFYMAIPLGALASLVCCSLDRDRSFRSRVIGAAFAAGVLFLAIIAFSDDQFSRWVFPASLVPALLLFALNNRLYRKTFSIRTILLLQLVVLLQAFFVYLNWYPGLVFSAWAPVIVGGEYNSHSLSLVVQDWSIGLAWVVSSQIFENRCYRGRRKSTEGLWGAIALIVLLGLAFLWSVDVEWQNLWYLLSATGHYVLFASIPCFSLCLVRYFSGDSRAVPKRRHIETE